MSIRDEALIKRIRDEVAGIVTGSGYYSTAIGVDEAAEIAATVLPIITAEVRKAKAEALTKRWVCQVARSGYHNGASCRPDDAHNDWGCDYYYEASIRATEYETGEDT